MSFWCKFLVLPILAIVFLSSNLAALPVRFVMTGLGPRLELQGTRGQHYSVSINQNLTDISVESTLYVGNGQTELISFTYNPNFPIFSQVIPAAGFTNLDRDRRFPIPRYQPEPVYPSELLRDSIEGSVVLRFVVQADGTVEDIQYESLTHEAFFRNAERAVQGWLFEPAVVNGQTVNTRVRIPILFNIDLEDPPFDIPDLPDLPPPPEIPDFPDVPTF